MLVGLATLISILFFGGVNEYFLIDKMDKGVKKYVVDKERQKEISSDLKESIAFIKAFNKERKGKAKVFKEMNASRTTTKEEFTSFFEELTRERAEFLDTIIPARIAIAAKIEPEEWTQILQLSEASIEKRSEITQKKIDKGKLSLPFEKTHAVIEKTVTDDERKEGIQKALDDFILGQQKAFEKMESMNAAESEILRNKNASRDELISLANSMNSFRQNAYEGIQDFHFKTRDLATEEEWNKIMKSFNKEFSITVH